MYNERNVVNKLSDKIKTRQQIWNECMIGLGKRYKKYWAIIKTDEKFQCQKSYEIIKFYGTDNESLLNHLLLLSFQWNTFEHFDRPLKIFIYFENVFEINKFKNILFCFVFIQIIREKISRKPNARYFAIYLFKISAVTKKDSEWCYKWEQIRVELSGVSNTVILEYMNYYY